MKKVEWEDATSYSRDEPRVPRSFGADYKLFRIVVVSGHINYEKGAILCTCHKLGIEQVLKSKTLTDAKNEAIAVVRAKINAYKEAIG